MNVTLGLIFVASHMKEWSMTFIAVRCPHCQSDQNRQTRQNGPRHPTLSLSEHSLYQGEFPARTIATVVLAGSQANDYRYES